MANIINYQMRHSPATLPNTYFQSQIKWTNHESRGPIIKLQDRQRSQSYEPMGSVKDSPNVMDYGWNESNNKVVEQKIQKVIILSMNIEQYLELCIHMIQQ